MKLTIVVDVDHDIDPAITDPHDIALNLIAAYADDRAAGYDNPAVEFVSAEWSGAEHLGGLDDDEMQAVVAMQMQTDVWGRG